VSEDYKGLTDALRDGWGEPDFPSADYTLAVVYPDGNPIEVQHFGSDLDSALIDLAACRSLSTSRAHWYVFDADDPERGTFDPPSCAGGVGTAQYPTPAVPEARPLAAPPAQHPSGEAA